MLAQCYYRGLGKCFVRPSLHVVVCSDLKTCSSSFNADPIPISLPLSVQIPICELQSYLISPTSFMTFFSNLNTFSLCPNTEPIPESVSRRVQSTTCELYHVGNLILHLPRHSRLSRLSMRLSMNSTTKHTTNPQTALKQLPKPIPSTPLQWAASYPASCLAPHGQSPSSTTSTGQLFLSRPRAHVQDNTSGTRTTT
jgi:hypothetical protein